MANFVKPYKNDPFMGHLSTPITTSAATLAILENLPAYRLGLSSLMRGLEIGMAHGYFFVGPFTSLGPLRNSEIANLAGFLSAVGLICILGLGLASYGYVSFDGSNEYEIEASFVHKGELIITDDKVIRTILGWIILILGDNSNSSVELRADILIQTNAYLASNNPSLVSNQMKDEIRQTYRKAGIGAWQAQLIENDTFETKKGWSKFTGGFIIGAFGGAFFAFLLLNSL
jgi:hypothetical protein